MATPKFNEEEQAADDHLQALMKQLREWGLNCNRDELAGAVHTLQLFIIMHMLGRVSPENFGEWYGDPTS